MAKFEFTQWLIDWIESQREFSFIWDEGNKSKSLLKHGVHLVESEEVFINSDKIVALGVQVSPLAEEPRFGLLGVTSGQRYLFISFTIRATGVRVISARPMNRSERSMYEKVSG